MSVKVLDLIDISQSNKENQIKECQTMDEQLQNEINKRIACESEIHKLLQVILGKDAELEEKIAQGIC